MLKKIFNRTVRIFSSVNFLQRVKKDKNGVCYVAGLRRHLSVLLDLIIIIILLQSLGYIINYFFVNSEFSQALSRISAKYPLEIALSPEEETVRVRYIKLIILNQIVQFIMLFTYITYAWVKFSTTPGKLLFGLRVVDSQSFAKITFKQARGRFFSLLLSIMPLFLGFIWASFDKHCQTWHDKIAGTVVVTNKSLIGFHANSSQ